MAGFIKFLIVLFLNLHILASSENKLKVKNNQSILGIAPPNDEISPSCASENILREAYNENYDSVFLKTRQDFVSRSASLVLFNTSVSSQYGHKAKSAFGLEDIDNISEINNSTFLGNYNNLFNASSINLLVPKTKDAANNFRKSKIHNENLPEIANLAQYRLVTGNPFQRLRNTLNKNDLYPQQILTVDVALGSELILASETRGEVYFEIFNHADTTQFVSFTCSDSKYILQSLSTYRISLKPFESTLVILYVHTYSGIYQDEITFTARTGTLRIQKRVLIDVRTHLEQYENTLYADWKYTSDCTGILYSQCSSASWRIEITAHAPGSGLLQLNTEPKGITIPLGYTVGTTEAVTGYYSESCCYPDLTIIAVDRRKNRISYNVNAFLCIVPTPIISLIVGLSVD
ncbi:uncharacterized protein LOC126748224 isoform X2 [Anthonomus grandis grandis]|uniref:uncharacterized protein LOC126748224 isoform X2 n=1 Tax=Anthonomus grandis grandis TaxID=2921223 RepID=UPI002165329B|nr:uncharacterized protein LOC126748224 isoform X2 [Anthonomus grandis grandis]